MAHDRSQRLPEGAAVEVELPSGATLRMTAGANDIVASELSVNGYPSFEAETTELWRELARDASVVFDIGAHTGLFALLAAIENPQARIFAFEPVPRIHELLVANVLRNGIDTVESLHLALCDREGQVVLHLPKGGTPSSASTRQGFRPDTTPIWVPASRADSFVEQRGLERVDLIKIDTESTEPLVLREMRSTIDRCSPVIVCEVLAGRTEEELMELLSPLGYRFWHISDEGLKEVDVIRGDRAHRFMNFLFSREPVR